MYTPQDDLVQKFKERIRCPKAQIMKLYFALSFKLIYSICRSLDNSSGNNSMCSSFHQLLMIDKLKEIFDCEIDRLEIFNNEEIMGSLLEFDSMAEILKGFNELIAQKIADIIYNHNLIVDNMSVIDIVNSESV